MTANSKKLDRIKSDRVTAKIVLQSLLSTKDGRRYLWNQLAEANVFADVEAVLQDHAALAFFMGKRAIGLRLFHELEAFPQGFIAMLRESANLEELEKEETNERPDFDT